MSRWKMLITAVVIATTLVPGDAFAHSDWSNGNGGYLNPAAGACVTGGRQQDHTAHWNYAWVETTADDCVPNDRSGGHEFSVWASRDPALYGNEFFCYSTGFIGGYGYFFTVSHNGYYGAACAGGSGAIFTATSENHYVLGYAPSYPWYCMCGLGSPWMPTN